jgi:hypothetical protein
MPPEYGTFRQAERVKAKQVQGNLALDFNTGAAEDEDE